MAVDKPTDEDTRAHNPPNTDVDGCFEITLARSLARGIIGKQRLQIQEAVSQHGLQLSQLYAYKRVELAAALQREFRRRAFGLETITSLSRPFGTSTNKSETS